MILTTEHTEYTKGNTNMTTKLNNWVRNLIAAVITGGATSGMSALGIAAADAAGANVGNLNLKQVGILFASGALVGLLAYLKQSPIPPAEDDPPAVPPFRPPVWIIGFAVLSLGLGACMALNKATVTLTSVVDAGMKDWAQASATGRTTPELDAKVVKAHNEYRKVCGAIVPIYETAIANGETPDAAAVLGTLRAAIDPLMDLILPVLLPAERAAVTTQLRKVNAP